jgi:hypothetical protein
MMSSGEIAFTRNPRDASCHEVDASGFIVH